MKPLTIPLAAILTVSLGGELAAKQLTLEEAATECSALLEIDPVDPEDLARVMALGGRLQMLARQAFESGRAEELLPVLNGAAADCLEYPLQGRGGAVHLTFDVETGRYRKSSQAEIAEKTIGTYLGQVKEIQSRDSREREIRRRVHSACSDLARRDTVAAYTNDLCVGSFLRDGLPEQ